MTTWFRRWMAGALQHQHQPLATDEHEGDGVGELYEENDPHAPNTGFQQVPLAQPTPWWQRLLRTLEEGVEGRQGYEPALQHETEGELMEDEHAQIEQAIRNSLQDTDERHVAVHQSYPSPPRESRFNLHPAGVDEEEAELAAALEMSRRDAELAAAGIATTHRHPGADGPPPPEHQKLPDLLEFDERQPLPDLLGGLDAPSGGAVTGASGAQMPGGSDWHALMGGGAPLVKQQEAKEKRQEAEQLLNDEMLARTLQEELFLAVDEGKASDSSSQSLSPLGPGGGGGGGSSWQQLIGGAILPTGHYSPAQVGSPLCSSCHLAIADAQMATCLGASWHEACFRCKACGHKIKSGVVKVGAEIYHGSCLGRAGGPKCHVCSVLLAANAKGKLEWQTHPFWGDVYCPSHFLDATPSCFACNRLQSHQVAFAELPDGRPLCLECLDSSIVDTAECTPLFIEVLRFFDTLGLPIKQEIPLLCVERQALNDAIEGEQTPHRNVRTTRGLCLSEERTVRTVVRLPGYNGQDRLGGIGHKELTLHRHCEVTAILVLSGLPRVMMGSILAHALMHAFLRLDGGFPSLAPEVVEGICQMLAHLWLQSQSSPPVAHVGVSAGASGSSLHEKYVDFCIFQIASDTSPVYGDGFCAARAAVLQFGLLPTLNHMRLTGSFPTYRR